jgi:hypothetical protein
MWAVFVYGDYMKQYPEMQNASKAPRKPCYGFVKYDGSNLRFEWSKKKGWHKTGTRKLMIDETHPGFGPAIPMFKQKYGDDLEKVFKKDKLFKGVDRVVVFCEWFGAKSFAGQHEENDPKTIILFDVNPMKKGMLGPKEFIDTFGHLEIAEMIYQGNLNDQLITEVRASNFDFLNFRSKYPITTEIPEGIICKGDKGHDLWMCKIKTQNYYDELKKRHPVDWEEFWE